MLGCLVLILSFSIWTPISAYALSDSSGPIFDGVAGYFADLVPTDQPVNWSMNAQVFVYDPDGVDSVIACHKNHTVTSWSNTTMRFTGQNQKGFDIYRTNLGNYTLDREHTSALWSVKYYANDSLGNWNVSGIANYSIAYFYSESSSLDILLPVIILIIVAFVLIVAVTIKMK